MGNSIIWAFTNISSDGKSIQQSSTDTRVSGGSGFIGKWKNGDIKGAATTLKITVDAAGGIILDVPEYQWMCKGSFDNKDNICTLAAKPSKYTSSFSKSSGTSFTMTTKLDGKPYYIDVYTVSADGKTLIDEGTALSNNEKTKSIYERL